VRKEANELIEEFMLLANISVAGKIASGLPDQSLLRRHEEPIDRRLDAFVQRMRRLGLDIDGSSSHALMDSIVKITDPAERLTLQHLSTRSMQRAKYFCTGMLDIAKYRHYALNVPLYTHFTSPIRRYADVIVHRQLEAVLAAQAAAASAETPTEAKFSLDAEAVSKIAQTCNTKKEAARLAQEQSQHLFLCVLIDDLTKRYGPVVRYGTVIGVLDQAFDVLVSEFGVEKRVHVDQMPVEVSLPSFLRSRE
jgi:protein SSD1